MDDIKGFVWIIGAIVFFIWRMVQKVAEKAKEAQQREQQQTRPTGSAPAASRPAPSVPAVSFEELLAQMQRQNQPPAPPARSLAERDPPQEWEQRQEQWDQEQRNQEPQAKPARSAPVPRFGRGIEKTEVEQYSQELPASEARSLESPKRELRRGSALPRTSTQHGQEDFWSQKKVSPKQTSRTVNELLRNPADIRAAFVLSEIFQRRY